MPTGIGILDRVAMHIAVAVVAFGGELTIYDAICCGKSTYYRVVVSGIVVVEVIFGIVVLACKAYR